MTDLWNAVGKHVEPTALQGSLQRLVESQEQVATAGLVSSLERQMILEDLLEESKPVVAGTEGLHYLLSTPFRYPPLRRGSRFGRAHEPGIFYGSHQTATVLAEAAYYRLVFWFDMAAPMPAKLLTQHTLFGADYRCRRGLRLQEHPLKAHRPQLIDPVDYRATQALGSGMRAAGIEAFEYESARDPQGGMNVGLFTPSALASTRPTFVQPWLCETDGTGVRFSSDERGGMFAFPAERFLVDGELPQPAS